jgi:hypothetical protein
MTILVAFAHIAGSIFAIVFIGALYLAFSAWAAERNKKSLFQDAALKLGVSVDVVGEDRFAEQTLALVSDRYSNELLRNRLSDFCGVVRTGWEWLGLILQIVAIGAAVWTAFAESPSEAVIAWVAPMVAIFFAVTSILFALVCQLLTGRLPGEAKLARKNLAMFLKTREPPVAPHFSEREAL